MIRLLVPRGQWPSLASAAGVRHLARRSGRRPEPEEGAAQGEEEVLEGRGRSGGRAGGEGVGFFGGALVPERGGKGGAGAELWPSTWRRGAAGAGDPGGPWDESEELLGRQRPPAAKGWGGKGWKGIQGEDAWGGSVEGTGRGSMGLADLRSHQAGTGPSRGKGGRGVRGDLSDSDDEFDYRSQALMDKGRSKGNGKGPLAGAPSSDDDRSTAHSTGRALDFSDSEDERSAPSQSAKGKGKGKRPGMGTFSESSDSDDELFQPRQGLKGKGKGKRMGKGTFSDSFDGEDEPSELSRSWKGKGKGKRLGKGTFSDSSDGEDEPSELSRSRKGKGKGKRLGKSTFSDSSDGEDEPSELGRSRKGKGKGKRLDKGTFSDNSDGEDEPSELSQSWKGKGKGKRKGKGAFGNSSDGEDEPYGIMGEASSKGKSRGSSLQDEDQDPGGRYLPPGEGNRIRNTRQVGQGRLPYSFEDYPTPGEYRGDYPDSDDEYRMTSRLGKGANLDHDTSYPWRSKGGKSKGAKGKGKNKDGLHFGDAFEDDYALPGKGGLGRGKGKKGGKGRGFYP